MHSEALDTVRLLGNTYIPASWCDGCFMEDSSFGKDLLHTHLKVLGDIDEQGYQIYTISHISVYSIPRIKATPFTTAASIPRRPVSTLRSSHHHVFVGLTRTMVSKFTVTDTLIPQFVSIQTSKSSILECVQYLL